MPATRHRVSIVIPAYNEARILGPSLLELAGVCECVHGGTEVVVVDDGSTDATADVVSEHASTWPPTSRLRLVSHLHNEGKGAAVRTGMLTMAGDNAVFTDADLAYGTEAILRFVKALEAGADMVVGVRRAHHGLARRIAGFAFCRVVRWSGLADVADSQSGIKGFKREAAREIFGMAIVDDFAFDVEVFVIARELGLRVEQLDIEMRASESSSVSLLPDAVRMLRSLRNIRKALKTGLYTVSESLGR